MKKQRLISGLVGAVLALSVAIPAFAVREITIKVEPDVRVYVDDKAIDAGDTHGNPEAFIYNGTTYIAAKAVSNSLGENVAWDGDTRSVYIGEHTVKAEPDASTFTLGEVSGTTYTNELVGLGYRLSGNWKFASAAELNEKNNIPEFLPEKYKEAMENGSVVFVMAATEGVIGADNVNLVLEAVDPEVAATIGQSELRRIYEMSMAEIESVYANAFGDANVAGEVTTLTVAGKERVGYRLSVEVSGLKIYQAGFMVVCEEGYLASVTITAGTEAALQQQLSNFYWL